MDLLTRIEASLEFMNDDGPIGDRVDFVNLREVLEGSREALLKLGAFLDPGDGIGIVGWLRNRDDLNPRLKEAADKIERLELELEDARKCADLWKADHDAAASRLDAVIPALQTIAMQKLRSEFNPDEQDGDYEFAYEVIVKMVRGAVERAGIMVALPSAPVVETPVTEQCGRGDRRSDS